MNTQQTIIDLIKSRGEVGLVKYGTTMDRNDLSPVDWIQHFQEEMADGLQYAERVKGALELLVEAYELIDDKDWLDKYYQQFGKL